MLHGRVTLLNYEGFVDCIVSRHLTFILNFVTNFITNLRIPKNLRIPNIIPDSTAVQTAIAIIPIICQPSIYIIEADICISIFIIYFHLLVYAKEEFIKYIDFNFSCSFVPCVLLRTISKVKSIYTMSTSSEN